MLEFTEKQNQLIRAFKANELKRLNILEGSVRSGKTWISLILWAVWVASRPKEHLYMMCAKSLKTLKRNCLLPLQALVGERNFSFSEAKKEGVLFGRKIMLEGANDERSESKIRGITLGGAYCDELTLFPKDFFIMLLSRLSVSGAKLIATTNPDTPSHWLLTEYLTNEELSEDIFRMFFGIDDNTSLDPEYVEALKREYTGVFYDRFILGLWKAAEGVIYRDFANDTERYLLDEPPDDLILGVCGLDFGGNGSAHAAALVGITRSFKSVVVLEEYYRKEIISPETLIDDVCAFLLRCKSRYKLTDMYCDNAETTLVKGIRTAVSRRRIAVGVHNARKGEIINRIRFCSMMMAQGRFFVMRHCKHTADALSSCVYDSKSLNDKRLDDGSCNIDSLDALEYALEPYMSDMMEMNGWI